MKKAFAALVLALATAGAGCDIVGAHVEATAQWQKTYSIPANGDVEIANVNGKIDVEPSSGNTVEITAIKKGRGVSDEAARAALERISHRGKRDVEQRQTRYEVPATSSSS